MESSRVHQGVLWEYWGEPRAWLGARPPCRASVVGTTDVASRSHDSSVGSRGVVQLPGVQLQLPPTQPSWRTLLDVFSSEAAWRTLL